MCNCPFRLTVNNLLFVGHPTTVQAPTTGFTSNQTNDDDSSSQKSSVRHMSQNTYHLSSFSHIVTHMYICIVCSDYHFSFMFKCTHLHIQHIPLHPFQEISFFNVVFAMEWLRSDTREGGDIPDSNVNFPVFVYKVIE
jgi:hypothetical protein